ncbi:MAG: FtsX-like permease family protein [Candidatus Latescibacteria bacterium]|jgi:putative ABC transport system permease protein|nr:FtsX-like permease family protein [Candidatus Latescibacterota bacterium]
MHKSIEAIIIALAALWANKLRSFLTLLCVIVSIMAIIAVVSIIDGMNSYVEEEVISQGTDVYSLERVNQLSVLTNFDLYLKSLRYPNVTLDDAEAIARDIPQAKYVDASASTNRKVTFRERFVDRVGISGRLSDYPIMGKWPIYLGRHLVPIDVMQRRAVCVIGWDVSETLFPSQDPIGQRIRFGGRHYEVVGVVKEKTTILGANQNVFIFIPVTSFLKHFGSRRSLSVSIKTDNLDVIPAAMEDTRALMRLRRKLRPGEDDNFHLATSAALMSLWEGISQGIFSALIGLVSITLVIGGIIIMNIMLVAVTERTREIGIRKALGAQRRDILLQFLVESTTLTMIGGLVGIAAGFFAAYMIASFSPLPYAVKGWSIGVALIIVLIVGLFFGIYPANRAAQLDPVDALRHE